MDIALPPKVTDRAFARLAEIAAAEGRPVMLRVAVEDDLRLEKDGQTVLVDPVSLPFLSGATIDFTEELIGARFAVDNPNATSSCGCGTSFSM